MKLAIIMQQQQCTGEEYWRKTDAGRQHGLQQTDTYERQGAAHMSTLTQAPATVERTFSTPVRLQTTLYDLIAAINTETEPEEEEVALMTIVHLLQTYRITCTHGGATYHLTVSPS
jgi:hypothetical protein